MARRRKSTALRNAEKYAEILLYEATGGTMGTESVKTSTAMTFGEKRGLLDSLVKIATMQNKDAEAREGDEESGLEKIMRQNAKNKGELNGSGKSWGGGNNGRAIAAAPKDSSYGSEADPGTEEGA